MFRGGRKRGNTLATIPLMEINVLRLFSESVKLIVVGINYFSGLNRCLYHTDKWDIMVI
jgi:hypothetical protein